MPIKEEGQKEGMRYKDRDFEKTKAGHTQKVAEDGDTPIPEETKMDKRG